MSFVAAQSRPWALLILFLLGLLLFQMGSRGLNEPDEGRYANIAQEALEPEHPWWDPPMSDVGHYDKPPLIYWVTALSFRFFGYNEWAARLPSFLGAVLTLGGLAWAAWRLYGEAIAWMSTLVGGTLLHIWGMARVLSPDMLLTGFCTMAIAAWIETRYRGGSWKWWSLQVLFWTLAFWTKATPALVPMLGLVLYVYVAGEEMDRRALRLPVLLPLSLALASPWFLLMVHLHPQLKDFFLRRELLGRMVGHVTGRHGPIYYYLFISLIVWLPWWPFAVAAAVYQREKLRAAPRHWSPEVFLVVTGLVVFSLIASKLPTYTLPLAPWSALMMTRLLMREPRFFSPPILAGVLVGVTAIYIAIGFILPGYESVLGRNSSVRPVVEFLRQQGATEIHADRLIFGLEFYGGEDVHFDDVLPPLEIFEHSVDNDPAKHFDSAPVDVIKPHGWFIHYQKQPESPFNKWISDPRVPKTVIGDFIVGPLT